MLDASLCRAALDPSRFLRVSALQDEASGIIGYQPPSPTQEPVLKALRDSSDWLYIVKPRQSHTSTCALLWLLSQVEYTPGWNGLIIADKHSTAEELMTRLLLAHSRQPPNIRVPATRSGLHGIQFAHGGRIKVASAGGSDPAIGLSIDCLVASEFALWPDGSLLHQIIPTVAKRPHARVIIETTPGRHGSAQHQLWLSTLQGSTRFKPVFIRWLDYLSYARPTHEEFKKEMLASSCSGDERLFSNQYPSDELDGWISTGIPALPEAPIKEMLTTARPDGEYLPPVPSHRYLIAADPNSFGSTGDPSAYTVVDLDTRTEVAAWSGRMDPLKFADALALLGKRYNDALLVVESNSAATITALVRHPSRPRVWQDEKDTSQRPGWWATKNDKERAIGALARSLHNSQLTIQNRNGLLQLLAYDGDSSKRVEGHHFDRVVTYYISADMIERLNVAPRRTPTPIRTAEGKMSVKALSSPTPRRPAL